MLSDDKYSDGRDMCSGEKTRHKLNSDALLMGGSGYCGSHTAYRNALIKV